MCDYYGMKKATLLLVILCLLSIPLSAQADSGEGTGNKFLRLFEDERRPIFKTDNLIFGNPEYLDFTFGFDTGFIDVFWVDLSLRLDYRAGPLRIVSEMLFINDQKYSPAHAMVPTGSLGNFYFLLTEGGLIYDKDWLKFSIGRFRVYDEIDSPYSLYVNSKGLSANTINFRVESVHFIYQTQWIGLNWDNSTSSPAWNEYQRRKNYPYNFYDDPLNKYPDHWITPSGEDPSDTSGIPYGFPDRGVNYKIFGIKVNDWRVGFLDAAAYSGRPIDFSYLLLPIPMYFVQYFGTTPGRPWTTEHNDNCLMGLFWDVKKPKWDAYVQVLFDDISLSFLNFLGTDFTRNPWKAAWALGGRLQTSIGRFGFHHGGALKYTFEPIGTDGKGRYKDDCASTAYGYTYYPETRYYDGKDEVIFLIEDIMVGYKYGENNLAFQVDYQNVFSNFLVNAELELVLAGNNSPANPWQDYDARASMYKDGRSGSQLFNDGQIEKRLEFRVNVSRRFGPLVVYSALAIGGRFNKLVLTPPDPDPYSGTGDDRTVDDEIWIWKASNSHEFIFRFSLGFRYTVPVI